MQELEELPPKVQLARLLEEKARRITRRKLFTYYPDRGALRRELYPKHQAFLAAGAKHRIRMMMAANRVGKSEGCGLYETTLHMTGRYPAWWQGKRFNRPVRVWVCGDTGKTLREILQCQLSSKPDQGLSRKTDQGKVRFQSLGWKVVLLSWCFEVGSIKQYVRSRVGDPSVKEADAPSWVV